VRPGLASLREHVSQLEIGRYRELEEAKRRGHERIPEGPMCFAAHFSHALRAHDQSAAIGGAGASPPATAARMWRAVVRVAEAAPAGQCPRGGVLFGLGAC
jgi:hypothetical protein